MSHQLHLPPMETWYSTFLDDVLSTSPHLPDEPATYASLESLGRLAVIAKMTHVELWNMDKASRLHKRLPEKLDFDEIAALLLRRFDFRMIATSYQSDDALLGLYVPSDDDIWSRASDMSSAHGTYTTSTTFFHYLIGVLSPKTKQKDAEEVLDRVRTFARIAQTTTGHHLFPVNNGIYDQAADALLPFSPDFVFQTKIGVDYVPTAQNPIITAPDGALWDVESWLADLAVSDEVETLLWEVISASLQPNRGMNKSIWFYSESGNNGKGTVGQLIKNLLGRGNYAPLSVADFKHEFLKQSLIGVAANISDENDVDEYIDSVKDYKASVTGDDILINRKHKDPVRVQFRGLNIQMMNGLPKTKDKTGSFYRRLIIVPFIKSFTNNGERKYIKDDYINRREVLEYVLRRALHTRFDEFTMPQASVHLLDQYREKNNPVLDFWNEIHEEFAWDLLPNRFLYDLYKGWYQRNNPSGVIIGQRTFFDYLSPIVDMDGNWENRLSSSATPIKSKDKMDADEPLITEYGLDLQSKNGVPSAWCDPNYRGTDITKRREFPRKDTYRGIVRK